MDDIKKPENVSLETEDTGKYANKPQPDMPSPSHTFIDETSKYNSDYHSNARIDTKPMARLDATRPSAKRAGFDGPALVVLQWLTYAFWGGTVVAMSILAVAILTFFITGTNIGDTVLYGMASVFVLLPLSLICDVVYLKNEPDAKSRLMSVVMIVHAVAFALFGVGSLITVAFSLVSLMVNSSGHDGVMVALYSSLITTGLFAFLFLSTVLPKKFTKVRYFLITIMVISIGVICGYGIFGPIADTQLTRNDKLIETNLSTVSEAVNSYTNSNSRLPDTLDSLKLKGDAKKLVTDKLVSYKKQNISASSYSYSKSYYYQLCVEYKKASADQSSTPYETVNSSSSSSSSASSADSSLYSSSYPGSGYSSYVSTIPHPAGNKCYKLVSYDYNSVIPMTDTKNY